MSKICPNCKYPNSDNADECFKCKADISEAAIRERQVRERLERQRVRQEQQYARLQQRREERLNRSEMQENAISHSETEREELRNYYLGGNIIQRLWADDLSNNPKWTINQIKTLLKIWDIVCFICATFVVLILLIFGIISVFNRNNNDSINNNSNITTEENIPVPDNIMPYGSGLPNRTNNYGGF